MRIVAHQRSYDSIEILNSRGDESAVGWLDAVSQLSKAVNDEMPLDEFFALAASIGANLPEAAACAIQLASRSGTHLLFKGTSGLSNRYIDSVVSSKQISLAPGTEYFDSPSSRCYRTGEVVCVDDILTDPSYAPWREVGVTEGYRSMVSIPLAGSKGPIGVLAVYSTAPNVGNRHTLQLFEVLADIIASILRVVNVRRRETQMLKRLAAANRALKSQHELSDNADAQHRGLMQLVFEGAGLDAIARWTAEILKCSVIIDNDQSIPIAQARPPGDNRMGAAEPMIDPQWSKLKDPDSPDLQCIPQPNGTDTAWVAPIFLDGKTVGHLWALDRTAPPNGFERRLLERATLVASVELWRERYERELDWRLIGDLLDEIMTGDQASAESTRRRAAQVGLDLGREHAFLLFWPEARESDGTRGLVAEPSAVMHPSAESAVRRQGYTAILAWRDQALEVLVERRAGQDRDEFLADVHTMTTELTKSLQGRNIVTIVSSTCVHRTDYPAARRAAYAVLDLAKQGHISSTRVIDVSRMGVTALLLTSTRQEDLLAFRDEHLGPLKEHDKRRDSRLVQTLKVHLETGGSNQVTAQNLFLHPNTVLYRLNNIEKLCQIDLRNTEVLLRMQLAMLIEELVGDA
jgi:sugar diacid utilization regulator